jgi:hypothetical protein
LLSTLTQVAGLMCYLCTRFVPPFWTGDFSTENICRSNIATGVPVSCFNTGSGTTDLGLAIFGEIT